MKFVHLATKSLLFLPLILFKSMIACCCHVFLLFLIWKIFFLNYIFTNVKVKLHLYSPCQVSCTRCHIPVLSACFLMFYLLNSLCISALALLTSWIRCIASCLIFPCSHQVITTKTSPYMPKYAWGPGGGGLDRDLEVHSNSG